jgi:hypothetical protein
MAGTFWVGIDVMRTLHAPKRPAGLFKLFDEVRAFHGVYNTHERQLSKTLALPIIVSQELSGRRCMTAREQGPA